MGILASYAVLAYSWNFTIFVIARIIGGLSKGNVTISTADLQLSLLMLLPQRTEGKEW